MAQVPATSVTYVGTGAQTLFTFAVLYDDSASVFVTVDGIDTPFTFSTPSVVSIVPAPALGAEVIIYRDTATEVMDSTFASGVPFLLKFADRNWRQLLYAIQEIGGAFYSGWRKVLRTPEDIPELPDAATRANGALLFDEFGNPAIRPYSEITGSEVSGPVSSLDDQVALFNGTTGKLIKAGQTIAQYFDAYLASYWRSIDTVALLSTVAPTVGRVYQLKEYLAGTGNGGGKLLAKAGVITPNNVTTFASATVGVYFERIQYDAIDIFMAGGQRGTDIRLALQAAVDASPSTYDITSAYTYVPSWKIKIPYGNYLLSARLLVAKNNIIIEGDGMFNTYIKSTSNVSGNAVQSEMVRFRGAYACGLKNLTLDGGLAFDHVSAPNYGCRIPLVLDQVAHMDMDGVNVCNYRTRGIQCIHVWESKFGEIRCFNGWGLDDALGIIPGGLCFDGFSKEENFFSGSESNQVYIEKFAFSGVGSIVRWDSPCFNVIINQGVFEGRTYSGYIPTNTAVSKIYLSGLSANCGLQHAWVYFHDQSYNTPAVFIEAANAGPGCYFDNITIYQENASPSTNFMELQSLLNSASAFPIRVNLCIQDTSTNTNLFQGMSAGSLYQGNVFYRNTTSRTLDNFMGATGATNFNGQVTMSTGAFGASVPTVYNFKAVGQDVSAINGSGIYPEYKCRAWVKFNGVTGAIIGSAMNVSGVVRNSAGNYSVTFATAMPDADYAATATSNASATGGERAYVAGYNASNMNVVNGVGAGFADASVITCAVFR